MGSGTEKAVQRGNEKEEKKSSDHGTCAEFWNTYILKIF